VVIDVVGTVVVVVVGGVVVLEVGVGDDVVDGGVVVDGGWVGGVTFPKGNGFANG